MTLRTIRTAAAGKNNSPDLGPASGTRLPRSAVDAVEPLKFSLSTIQVKVIVNGRTAFEGRVERSVKTLLQWAAHDNDRTMLYGAELRITVPGGR